MSTEKRFDDKESGDILRRALEMQTRTENRGSDGLSMQDLERIASEIGIDQRHVSAAANELGARKTDAATISLERVVDGEVDDAAWVDMVAEMRRTVGQPGIVSRLGTAREWTVKYENYSTLTISAYSQNGSTQITLMTEYSGGIWAFGMVAGGIAFVLSLLAGKLLKGPLQGPWPVIAGFICFGVLAFLIRWLILDYKRNDRVQLAELVDRLASRVSGGAKSLPLVNLESAAPVVDPPRHDLDVSS